MPEPAGGRGSRIGNDEVAQALAAYANWLEIMFSGRPVTMSGSDLLATVADLQRRHFPDAARGTGAVLVTHTEVASLLFEHRMCVLRNGTSSTLHAPLAQKLFQRQLENLDFLHMLCLEASAAQKQIHGNQRPA